MKVRDFGEKLTAILRDRGMTQVALADKLGITARHLSRLKAEGADINPDLLENICSALDVPLSDFGKAFLNPNPEFINVPFREAGGGMGGGYYSGSKKVLSYISLRRDFLLTKTSNLDALSFIHASGESMFPTIPPDAAVLIDESQTEPVNGKIFFVMLNDSYLIKRLEVRSGVPVALISDNGNRREEICADDTFQILGRAILQQTLL